MANPADSALPPPTGPTSVRPNDADVLQWGTRGLTALLILGIGASLLLAWYDPILAVLAPAGVLAIVLLVWLARHPYHNLGVALFGFTFAVISDQGVNPAEILYGVYLLFFFATWYARYLLPQHQAIYTLEDRIVALLLTIGLVAGIALGLIFGSPLSEMRGAVQGYLMLAFYFPIRDLCRRYERGPEVVLVVTAWLGLFVAASIFINFREVLVQATVDWQVADARPGYNALQLTSGALLGLIILVSLRGWTLRFAAFGLFTTCLSALILIKYRGFWVAFAFGAAVTFLLLQRTERRRLLAYAAVGVVMLAIVTTTLFGNLATLLFSGTIERFATLQTALTQDISLLNRFHEATAALEYIFVNPILGYGFGTRYSYYSWIYLATYRAQLIHIGYVEIWFRLGLFGMIGIFLLWGRALWSGWKIHKSTVPRLHRIAGLLSAVGLSAMIFSVFTESPWFQMNQMFGFTMLTAVAIGLRQRYADRLNSR